MPADLSWQLLPLLLLAAFAAGWLDSIGGGGGLIQLPALLLFLPPQFTHLAIGTNKLSSIIGTTAAAANYARAVPPPTRTVAPMMATAFVASGFGSWLATRVDASALRPAILIALVVVFFITLLNPASRVRAVADHERPNHNLAVPVAIGAALGFYDGLIGPGTGAFLLVSLVQLVGLSFLRASATAKFVNWSTNLASVIIFASQGSIWWQLGIALGVANLAGGFLGSRLAIKRGSEFVRKLLLVAVALLILRLAWSLL